MLGSFALAAPKRRSIISDDVGAERSGIDLSEPAATAERVKGLVAALLEDLYAADFALAAISNRYFRGNPLVVVDQEERLRKLIDLAEKFVQLFNAVINHKDSISQIHPLVIDVGRVKPAAKDLSKITAAALVDDGKTPRLRSSHRAAAAVLAAIESRRSRHC
jgi:hypothetical protein